MATGINTGTVTTTSNPNRRNNLHDTPAEPDQESKRICQESVYASLHRVPPNPCPIKVKNERNCTTSQRDESQETVTDGQFDGRAEKVEQAVFARTSEGHFDER